MFLGKSLLRGQFVCWWIFLVGVVVVSSSSSENVGVGAGVGVGVNVTQGDEVLGKDDLVSLVQQLEQDALEDEEDAMTIDGVKFTPINKVSGVVVESENQNAPREDLELGDEDEDEDGDEEEDGDDQEDEETPEGKDDQGVGVGALILDDDGDDEEDDSDDVDTEGDLPQGREGDDDAWSILLPRDLSDLNVDIADDITAGVEESLKIFGGEKKDNGTAETRQMPMYMFQGQYVAEARLNRFIDGALRNMGTEMRISSMDPIYFRVLPRGRVEHRQPGRIKLGKVKRKKTKRRRPLRGKRDIHNGEGSEGEEYDDDDDLLDPIDDEALVLSTYTIDNGNGNNTLSAPTPTEHILSLLNFGGGGANLENLDVESEGRARRTFGFGRRKAAAAKRKRQANLRRRRAKARRRRQRKKRQRQKRLKNRRRNKGFKGGGGGAKQKKIAARLRRQRQRQKQKQKQRQRLRVKNRKRKGKQRKKLVRLRRQNKNRNVGGGKVEGLSKVTRDGDAEMQLFGNYTLIRSHMRMGPVELSMQFRTRKGIRRTGATLSAMRAHMVTRVNHEGSEMVDFLLDRPHPEAIQVRGNLFPLAKQIARNIFARLFLPDSFLVQRMREKTGLALLSRPSVARIDIDMPLTKQKKDKNDKKKHKKANISDSYDDQDAPGSGILKALTTNTL